MAFVSGDLDWKPFNKPALFKGESTQFHIRFSSISHLPCQPTHVKAQPIQGKILFSLSTKASCFITPHPRDIIPLIGMNSGVDSLPFFFSRFAFFSFLLAGRQVHSKPQTNMSYSLEDVPRLVLNRAL